MSVTRRGDVGPASHLDLQALRSAPLLTGLADDVLARIAAFSELVMLPEGGRVGQQGEMADTIYLLLSGQIAISNVAPNGESAVVEVLPPGSHLFLATALAGLPLLVQGQAISAAQLIAIDAQRLLELVQQQPSLATALLRAEALEFRAMVRQVCDLKLRTTAQRLGCYLLSLSPEADARTASLRLPFDKRLLAARLGCRQENLSRAFAALRSFGVETHGARVILHDIPRLREYAVPDEQMGAAPG
jgi:CRP-like cAMP-binding protein